MGLRLAVDEPLVGRDDVRIKAKLGGLMLIA
jgi:hypothetical protein